MMAAIRSWMFVPGNRQRFLDKAAGSDADVVFFDLEDGVVPGAKDEARSMVTAVLGQASWTGPRRYVRLNAASTPWFERDIAGVVIRGLDGVCLPKVESADDLHNLSSRLAEAERKAELAVGSTSVVAAIESAAGLIDAGRIAKSDRRLVALMFGAEDYALDIGLSTHRQEEAAELTYERSAIVVAAAAARIDSIDGVFPNLDDPEGLRRDAVRARRLGFSGKSTFNPRQVEVINAIFSPDPEEIEYATTVVEAFSAAERRGDASVAIGGQLVDLPIVRRAQRILEMADSVQRAGDSS